MLREGLAHLLRNSGLAVVVAGAASLGALGGLMLRHRPNLLVVNESLPDGDPIAWCAERCHLVDGAAMLVFAERPTDFRPPLNAGIPIRVVSKRADFSAVIDALGELARGLAEGLAYGGQRRPTSRETEVLALVSAGLQAKEIARQLDVQPKTVYAHIANLKAKTGTASLSQLALWARSRDDDLPR